MRIKVSWPQGYTPKGRKSWAKLCQTLGNTFQAGVSSHEGENKIFTVSEEFPRNQKSRNLSTDSVNSWRGSATTCWPHQDWGVAKNTRMPCACWEPHRRSEALKKFPSAELRKRCATRVQARGVCGLVWEQWEIGGGWPGGARGNRLRNGNDTDKKKQKMKIVLKHFASSYLRCSLV